MRKDVEVRLGGHPCPLTVVWKEKITFILVLIVVIFSSPLLTVRGVGSVLSGRLCFDVTI